MDALTSLIPAGPGLLPKWQLLVSSIAICNAIQNFVTLKFTKQIYGRTTVTVLQARTFAIWTLTAGIVRFYAAYHLNDPVVYDITIWTYALAGVHFYSEFLVYRTAPLGPGVLSPMIVATTSLIWMLRTREFYLAGSKA